MQERVTPPQVLTFDGLVVIVGGGTVDHDLMRDLYVAGAHLVGADGGADEIVAAVNLDAIGRQYPKGQTGPDSPFASVTGRLIRKAAQEALDGVVK